MDPSARVRLVATGGPRDGRGHLVRSLALAEALVERGLGVDLALVEGTLTDEEGRRATSLGLDVAAFQAGDRPDEVLVVDLPDPLAVVAGVSPGRLVVFDDRNQFAGRAAIIVQPSQAAWSGPGTADRVLAGYAYVAIRGDVRALRAADPGTDRPDRHGPPLQVLACFGGSDPERVSERLAEALTPADEWTAELVVGASYQGATDGWPLPVVRDPIDLPARIAGADLVVGGAGTMKFEVACLGRPALLVAVSDDQLPVGPPFAATGGATYLGDGRTIAPADVRAAVTALARDPFRRRDMGRRAAGLVDGRGGERIAEAIAGLLGAPPS